MSLFTVNGGQIMLLGFLLTMVWCVLRFQIGDMASTYGVKLWTCWISSQTADKGWFSSMGVGRGANNFSP